MAKKSHHTPRPPKPAFTLPVLKTLSDEPEYNFYRTDMLTEQERQEVVKATIHTLRQSVLNRPVNELIQSEALLERLHKMNCHKVHDLVRMYRNYRFDGEPNITALAYMEIDKAYNYLVQHGIVGGYHVSEMS